MNMENESLKANQFFSSENNSLSESLRIYDFPALIENMKHSQSWSKGKLDAMILLRSPNKQIVLTVLHEGTEINSFQSNDSVTFQIIEGKLMFQSADKLLTLYKGQLLTLHEHISYCLTTDEDTALLFTLEIGALQRAEN